MRSNLARANVLLAAAAWTFYVWLTRMWNILRDPDHEVGVLLQDGLVGHPPRL